MTTAVQMVLFVIGALAFALLVNGRRPPFPGALRMNMAVQVVLFIIGVLAYAVLVWFVADLLVPH